MPPLLASTATSGTQTVQALLFTARLHLQQNQLADAARCYWEIVRLSAGCFEAQAQLGALCNQSGKLPEAVGFLQTALRLQPGFRNLNLLLGSVYKKLGRFEEAARCCRREAEIAPNNPDVHYNLGLVLQNLDRPGEAVPAYQRALALCPTYTDAFINLANAHRQLRHVESALPLLERAVQLEPENAEAHWELCTTLLALGEFSRGWEEYEWRWRQDDFTTQLPRFSQPRWTGEALNGSRILLHAEQGYGDAIQFMRYAPLVAERGGRVFIGCSAPLRPLFETVPGVERVATQLAPLMSLPSIFKTTLATVPAQVPYFVVPENSEATPDLEPARRRRIGLAWAGRPTHRNDRHRSIPFEMIARLLREKQADWFSLQVGESSPQLGRLIQEEKITDLRPQIGDFLDTAKAISRLDLVIAVDSAVAHLAGGMGKPVWLLLPFEAEWRWLLDRDDSPWYPTMRLFRQSRPGNWPEVIERVRAALCDFTPDDADPQKKSSSGLKSPQGLPIG